MGGTALSEGIGEVLTGIAPMPDCVLLVAKPAVSVSTKYVYEQLDSREIPSHPDVDAMMDAIRRGDVREMAGLLGNVLATTACGYLIRFGLPALGETAEAICANWKVKSEAVYDSLMDILVS